MTSSSMDRSSPMTQTYAYRERVRSTLELAALVVKPKERAGVILKALRGTLYVQRGIRSVQDMHVDLETGSVSDEGREGIEHCKLVLLDPEACNVQALRASPLCHCSDGVGKGPTALNFCLPEELASGAGGPTVMGDRLRDKLMNLCGTGVHVALTTHFVELSHKNYTMSELLTMLLSHVDTRDNGGAALVALSGFEQVGHIAHVNLSSAHLPYKEMIGQVILDCNPSVTVVVNKMDTISSIYREFAMDVIAQRADALYVEQPDATLRTAEQEARRNELLTATVRQHGCLFRVPYDRVYWNSRLSHEHTRLVERMEEGDALFDVMAGVGPFAIPAAQRGVQVYANDLNPVAAEYMRINAELNHVAPLDMLVYNLDGRDFLNQVLYEHVMGLQGGTSNGTSVSLPQCRGRRHVTMNLPALAVRFLDVFSARMPDSPWRRRPAGATKVDKRVLFHVYCFSSANDVLADAVAQVEESIGYILPDTHREAVVMVRDVAPTKRMVCVSFTLPDAFWDDQEVGVGDDVPIKCRRTE